MYYKLKKEFKICCAHKLTNKILTNEDNKKCFGKCNETHGHNYKVIVKLKSKMLENHTGMIINFDELKKIFKQYIDDEFDHKNLNLQWQFKDIIPTAENMCKVFYDILKENISDVYEVEIYETDGASACYGEE